MAMVQSRARKTSPGAGRPTREQAQRRHEELLDRALDLFLERGFELTTIDAITESVGMTKRTVYARYDDKRALFKAAVQRAVEKWIIPIKAMQALETDDLETTLRAVARQRIDNALSPAGQHLSRIINTESYRFPELQDLAYQQGTRPAVEFLCDLLRRHAKQGAVMKVTNPELAVEAFLSMLVGGPSRGAMAGKVFTKAELEERTRFCVRLFLDGIRKR